MKPLILTKAQDQQTRVVLGEFLAMGDEVIVCRNTRDPESLHYTKLPPDGTRAWVVGFTTYFDFHGRVGRYDRKPGVYRRYGAPVFQWIDEAGNEQIGRLHTHHLIWADASLDPQKTRRDTEIWRIHDKGVFVRDLPETPVIEGDIVQLADHFKGHFPNDVARVEGIDYSWDGSMDQFNGDPAANIYRLTPLEGGFTMNLNANAFVLKERGNYYWYEHDPSQMKFADLKDKASFYKSVGLSEELRNPHSGNYAWSLHEALDYLSEGKGAGIVKHGNPFAPLGAEPSKTVHLYDFPTMPDLAKEIREATLHGFNREPA